MVTSCCMHAGMIGWWPSRAVTFVDNHDTGSTQAHWPFPQQALHQVRVQARLAASTASPSSTCSVSVAPFLKSQCI